MTKEMIENTDYMNVAEQLYKFINPTSKMDTPNSVYETTYDFFKEWANTTTDLSLFEWVLKFKK